MLSGEVHMVYETVKQKILEGEYAPGQPLVEMTLAETYNIKRTRVRQILSKLEGDRLVDKLPAKGAFVTPITPELLQALFEVREALEPMAARLAARRRDAAELQEVIDLFAAHERRAAGNRLERKAEIGGTLHRFIRKSARNEMISDSLEVVELQTRRIWREGLSIEGRIVKAYEDHKKILESLRNQDETAAEALMRQHIVDASADYFNVLFSR